MSSDPSIADLAAETASSYGTQFSSFKQAFGNLLELAFEVGAGEKRWIPHVAKLRSLYQKSNDSDVFKPMFSKFYTKYKDELLVPIFKTTESGDSTVNDQFFKKSDKFSLPESKRTNVNVNVNGPVVLFDDSRSDLVAINLPIGEMYNAALQKHKERKDDERCMLLPTLVLLEFYLALYFSTDDENVQFDLNNNVLDLCDAAEATVPGSGPGNKDEQQSSLSNPFEMLSGFIEKSGLAGAFGVSGGDIKKTLGGFNGVFNRLVEEVSRPGGEPVDSSNVSDVMARIGSAFQNAEIQSQLTEATQSASGIFNSITSSGKSKVEVLPPTD